MRSSANLRTSAALDTVFPFMFYCNELPAVRRVDGVCVVYVRRKTKHDLTVRDRLTCISNALSLSLVVEVTDREEE